MYFLSQRSERLEFSIRSLGYGGPVPLDGGLDAMAFRKSFNPLPGVRLNCSPYLSGIKKLVDVGGGELIKSRSGMGVSCLNELGCY